MSWTERGGGGNIPILKVGFKTLLQKLVKLLSNHGRILLTPLVEEEHLEPQQTCSLLWRTQPAQVSFPPNLQRVQETPPEIGQGQVHQLRKQQANKMPGVTLSGLA